MLSSSMPVKWLRFRSACIRIALTWFVDMTRSSATLQGDAQLPLLRSLYQSSGGRTDGTEENNTALASPPTFRRTKRASRRDSVTTPATCNRKRSILDSPLEEVATSLLVVTHAALSVDSWSCILPMLWQHYDSSQKTLGAVTFLLEKCAEVIPMQFRAVIISDLSRLVKIPRQIADHQFTRIHTFARSDQACHAFWLAVPGAGATHRH